LLRRARSARRLVAANAVLGFATALLLLVQAALIARIVARAFHGAAVSALLPGLVALAFAFAARGVLAWAFEIAGRRTATTVLSELRLALVHDRVRVRPAAFDAAESGALAAAAVQGVDGLAAYFGRYLPQVVLAAVVPLAVLVYVATVDPLSAAVMFVTLPFVPVFMWLIGRYTEERTKERWESLLQLSTHFLDVVRGLPTLRTFNRSAEQATEIERTGDRYRIATMGTLRVAFLSGSVLELAATLGVALVAVTVGVRLDNGGLGLEAALTVLVLAPELYRPLRELAAQYHASADGLAAAGKLLDAVERPATAAACRVRTAPSPSSTIVRLECVSFAYPGRAGLVLDGFDLELQPGETVALVGASGAGKSTVASLLLRLAEPSAGRVTAGGVDLAECVCESWRRQLAWVPQRPTIFRGTVAENIRLGVPTASPGRVAAAATLAGADVFVRDLPDAYDTVIGDGGRVLSTGERRRIALARAILRDAPLLILDEPTADLDPVAAELVGAAIGELRLTRTVLVIAHRPELAAQADRIVVLAGGRAAEPVVRSEAA
jgi:thiol reductant ABC exporter CydD subunit